MENLKIRKGKTYTYEELKEIFKNAQMTTLNNPTGEHKQGADDARFQFSMMLSGVVILHTLEDNLFEKENDDNE